MVLGAIECSDRLAVFALASKPIKRKVNTKRFFFIILKN
ncbi:hypothetical protein FLAVO9AF_760002 [Flavobacterium sp. 9AF]|nr:hypothetical protein FLAVO9AF_760002 [Flavobacterium sp. 9AF]